MKITRNQIRRIIQEQCGATAPSPAPEVVAIEPAAPSAISENITPAQEMMVEMAAAKKALQIVVESAQGAAHACSNCDPSVAAHAPVMEAVVAQAAALQEMLEAQAEVLAESAESSAVDAVVDMVTA